MLTYETPHDPKSGSQVALCCCPPSGRRLLQRAAQQVAGAEVTDARLWGLLVSQCDFWARCSGTGGRHWEALPCGYTEYNFVRVVVCRAWTALLRVRIGAGAMCSTLTMSSVCWCAREDGCAARARGRWSAGKLPEGQINQAWKTDV